MMICESRESRLNPNAPIFLPNAAYDQVEDFSSEWWDMVKTSPRFRDYWLSIHHEDDFITEDESDFLELDDFVSSEQIQSPPSKDKKHGTGTDAKSLLKVLNLSNYPEGRAAKSTTGHMKFCEKKNKMTVKVLSPKCTALRRIQQPR